MGKSYIESSLKRFLKRKVKITLGLVVTFMITGAVAFAEGTTESHFAEHNKDFTAAEEYLKELGSDISEINIKNNEQQGFIIKKDEGDYKFTLNNFKVSNNNLVFTDKILKKEFISSKTAEKINQTLALLKNNDSINNIITSNISINNGVAIQSSKAAVQTGNEAINDGLIVVWDNGQYVTKKAINNGIILGNRYAQYGSDLLENYGVIIVNKDLGQFISGKGTANNYGIIISNNDAQKAGGKGVAYNYGILSAKNNPQSAGTDGKIYNYGIINGNNGQYLMGQYIEAQNYGVINSENGIGQLIEHGGKNENQLNKNSILKNYGIINGKYGQVVTYYYGMPTENSTVINNGVIKSTEAGMNITKGATGTNNGIIINGKDKVFISKNLTQSGGEVEKGTTINNGILILSQKDNTDNIDLKELGLDENNGIILNKNYELVGNKVGGITEGVNQINSNYEISGKDKKVYLKDGISKIKENLSGQNINAVITKNSSVNSPVFSYIGSSEDKKLVIADTNFTGYFQKDGTLLDVGDNDLSLLGNTKIIAGKDEMGLDVTAININGVLKKLGDIEITGKITGTGRFQDIATNGEDGKYTSAVELNEVLLQNATEQEEKYLAKAEDNYTEVSYTDLTTNQVILDFDRTATGKENTITFTDNLLIKGKDGVAVDGRGTAEGNNINLNFSSLDSDKVKGDIILGASDDDIVVEKNGIYNNTIDMGAGIDSFTVKGFTDGTAVGDKHHKEAGNTFDYKVNGAEKIVLNGKGWHIGDNAELNGGTTAKAGEKTELHIADNSSLHVDMNNNYGKGKVTTSLDKMAGGADLSLTTGAANSEVKFVVGDKFNVSEKQFDVGTNYDVEKANVTSAVIFKTEKVNGKDIRLTVKEASEITSTAGENKGVNLENYKAIYDTMLGALSSNEELRAAVNYSNVNNLVDMVVKTNNTAEAFYTTGYAVTKDVTDTYMSVVDDFGRKAGKGEWIAYGKYVNSDTEFDGGKASKGYDGDITGTVGMLEYGVNETTSYGVVYGQGDTEVDIQGGGKLDGDNTYFGGYVKHRTQGGFDITGNVGYTKSELDLNLATSAGVYNMITSGKSDADALTFALKGKKDYFVTDTVKLQPVFGARYTLVNQDAVESSDANFRMDEQDVTIFEGMFGGNAVKEFDLYNGKLSLSAGAEYVLADVSKSDDARYTLYGKDIALTGEEDIADNRIEGHIGIDYEHESGVGVDAKYEMIWTDKGDSDRITAGISYRF